MKHTIEEIAAAFGMTNPRPAHARKDIKTKLGLAFVKGEALTVYESGPIESGRHAGKMGYSAFSPRNDLMTAILASDFVWAKTFKASASEAA